MKEAHDHLTFLKGTPFEAGYALGARLGKRLEANIERYLRTGPLQQNDIDLDEVRQGVASWLDRLPARFREELQGMAEGSGVPLRKLAECYAVEDFTENGCTGFFIKRGGELWVARNNDYLAPDMWGYACVRDISGRIPWIGFGMEGDIFAVTGMNREKVWLHYNYLRADDAPFKGRSALSPYVWLTDALETCASIQDVEEKLGTVNRTSGMMLFAADGKTEEGVIFECTCTGFTRRNMDGDRLIGTNHFVTDADSGGAVEKYPDSVHRMERVEALLRQSNIRRDTDMFGVMKDILADDQVEARGDQYYTVYSAIACPGKNDIRYTFGGFPAASKGAWQILPDLVI